VFILSGGFSWIPVSQGMVLAARSPLAEAACPQRQPACSPPPSPSARATARQRWGRTGDGLPGGGEHFTPLQLSQHLLPPAKRSFGRWRILCPAAPLPPSSLLPAPGSAGRDAAAVPIRAETGQNEFRARARPESAAIPPAAGAQRWGSASSRPCLQTPCGASGTQERLLSVGRL